jgi:hypothetical protein
MSGDNITSAAFKGTGTDGATRIYASTMKGFFVSADSGLTWTQESSGLPGAGKNIRWVTVNATNGANLWISVSGGGIYESTDSGVTWTAKNTGITSPTTATLDVIASAPSSPNTLYTADTGGAAHNAYKSTDGGTTWTSTGMTFGVSPYPVYRDFHCIAINLTNPNSVYAGTATDIWETENGGTNWTDTTSVQYTNDGWKGTGYFGEVAWNFRWNPFNTAISAACAMDSGKWISQDGYGTWFFGGAGRAKGMNDWFGMHDIAFTATAGTWYAVQGQGNTRAIYKTTNSGTTWTSITQPAGISNEPTGIYANPSNPAQVWVAWSGMLFYSSTSGSSWTQLVTNTTTYGSVSAITGDATNSNPLTIWIGTSNGLYKTTDGTNFVQQGATGTAAGITRIRLDSTNPDRVWIVNANYSNINSWDTGLWLFNSSTNVWSNLASWGNPSSPVKNIVDVDVDPTNTNQIVVATNVDPFESGTGESGVWVNTNSGASNAWIQQNTGLPMLRVKTIAFRPGTSQLVAGLNGRGFYIANTDGSTIDLAPPTDDPVPSAAPTAGTLTIHSNVFSFGTTATGGYLILENGVSAGGGAGVSIFNNNGTLDIVNSLGNWYSWNEIAWTRIYPASLGTSNLAYPTTGTLTVGSNVYSFGTTATGGYYILENGVSAGGGSGVSMFDNKGTVEIVNSLGNWYSWNGTVWTRISAPIL